MKQGEFFIEKLGHFVSEHEVRESKCDCFATLAMTNSLLNFELINLFANFCD